MGNIARIFKVSTVAVLKWIKAAAAHTIPLELREELEAVMIDEFGYKVQSCTISLPFKGNLPKYRNG